MHASMQRPGTASSRVAATEDVETGHHNMHGLVLASLENHASHNMSTNKLDEAATASDMPRPHLGLADAVHTLGTSKAFDVPALVLNGRRRNQTDATYAIATVLDVRNHCTLAHPQAIACPSKFRREDCNGGNGELGATGPCPYRITWWCHAHDHCGGRGIITMSSFPPLVSRAARAMSQPFHH